MAISVTANTKTERQRESFERTKQALSTTPIALQTDKSTALDAGDWLGVTFPYAEL